MDTIALIGYAPLVLSVCGIIITAIVSYITIALNKHLNISNDAQTASLIGNAVSRAGGIAYDILNTWLTNKLSTSDNAKKTAIDVGVSHVMNSVPDALSRLNLPDVELDSRLRNMILGELGKLQASSIKKEAVTTSAVTIGRSPNVGRDEPPVHNGF